MDKSDTKRFSHFSRHLINGYESALVFNGSIGYVKLPANHTLRRMIMYLNKTPEKRYIMVTNDEISSKALPFYTGVLSDGSVRIYISSESMTEKERGATSTAKWLLYQLSLIVEYVEIAKTRGIDSLWFDEHVEIGETWHLSVEAYHEMH